MAGAREKRKDGRRNIANEEIGNDNCEDPAQFLLGAGHEMQAGVQHDRLSYHHTLPAGVDQGDTEYRDVDDTKEFEEQAESVRNYGNGGDHEGPEVQAIAPAEGQRNENQKFDHVVERDTSKSGNQLCNLERRLNGAFAHVVVRHLVGLAEVLNET